MEILRRLDPREDVQKLYAEGLAPIVMIDWFDNERQVRDSDMWVVDHKATPEWGDVQWCPKCNYLVQGGYCIRSKKPWIDCHFGYARPFIDVVNMVK